MSSHELNDDTKSNNVTLVVGTQPTQQHLVPIELLSLCDDNIEPTANHCSHIQWHCKLLVLPLNFPSTSCLEKSWVMTWKVTHTIIGYLDYCKWRDTRMKHLDITCYLGNTWECAHSSLLQWCCLGNITVGWVILHIGVGCCLTLMCKMTIPQGRDRTITRILLMLLEVAKLGYILHWEILVGDLTGYFLDL